MEKLTSYYAVIPASVRYDENLSPNAKLLYGEITSLCNEKGYCWATNEYFAKLYKVSTKSITRWICDLCNCGHIESKIIKDPKVSGGIIRILKIPCQKNWGETGMDKNVWGGQNCPYPYGQKCLDPTVKNDQYNKLEEYNSTSQIFSETKMSRPPKENQTPNDNFSSEELSTQENEILTEPKISDSELKKKKNFDTDSDPYLLAKLLERNIANNNPKFPQSEQQRQRWAKDFDLMIRRDKLQADDIAAVIDWCQKDSFWRCNILSGKKLRDKYQQLSMKMMSERR